MADIWLLLHWIMGCNRRPMCEIVDFNPHIVGHSVAFARNLPAVTILWQRHLQKGSALPRDYMYPWWLACIVVHPHGMGIFQAGQYTAQQGTAQALRYAIFC